MSQLSKRLNTMVKLALLTAISVILMSFSFPIFPSASWLKLDFSDVPVLIGGVIYGPIAGIVVAGIKNIIHLLQTNTGAVGELANFLISISIVVPVSVICKRDKKLFKLIIGSIVGVICISIVGVIANKFLFVPLFGLDKSMTVEQINHYLYAVVAPFNALKGTLSTIVTIAIYIPLKKVLK